MTRRTLLLVAIGVLGFGAWATDEAFYQGTGFPPPHMKVEGLFSNQSPTMPGSVAVLLSGGISPDRNHPRYWNNLSLMYRTLKTRGWEHVLVLDGDGTSPEPDQLTRSFLGVFSTDSFRDSPLDLDFDGDDDITGPGTKAALEATLRKAMTLHTPGAPVFVFITDHGQLRWQNAAGEWGMHAVTMMWGEEMTGEEFQGILQRTVPADTWVSVLTAACHSDIFLWPFERENSMLIAAGRPLWIWSDQDYSVFPFHFAEALLGKNPETGEVLTDDAGLPTIANTFTDAFHIASERDHAPEWPGMRVIGDPSSAPFPLFDSNTTGVSALASE